MLGREIPEATWDRTAPIGFNDTISQGVYLKKGIGKGIYNLIENFRRLLVALGKKERANDLAFIVNMPWRNVARMSGFLGDDQVMALLDMVNGQKGGFRKFIKTKGPNAGRKEQTK